MEYQPENAKESGDIEEIEAQIRNHLPKVSADFNSLIKYMDLVLKRTELSSVASVVKAGESCKDEINGNVNEAITSVSSSVKDIKKDLSNMEKFMEEKIGSMQNRLVEAERRADEAVNEMRRIELAGRKKENPS